MLKNLFTISFLLIVACASGQVITDTIWNDQWDPNDPNCPCYKIQKQADEEYRVIQQEKQDSLLRIHKKESTQIKKRKRRNERRKKNKDCPEAFIYIYRKGNI